MSPRLSRRLGRSRRADGSTHVRPGGALVLCALVWLFCGATVAQALWLLGAAGWRLTVLPLVVSAVVWALLWAPRVVVRPEQIEVRNVLVTHVLPMAVIDDVRLGAMLRIVLAPARPGGRPATITAWNAPGVGRDDHRDRIASGDVRSRHGSGAGGRPPRADWAQRLRRDQAASPSQAAVDAWETWRSGRATAPTGEGAADGEAGSTRHLNRAVLVVLAAAAAMVVARVLV